MVPSGTPKPVIERLTTAIDKAMQSSETIDRIHAAGLEVDYRRSSEFGRFLGEQRTRFAEIIKKNNIHID